MVNFTQKENNIKNKLLSLVESDPVILNQQNDLETKINLNAIIYTYLYGSKKSKDWNREASVAENVMRRYEINRKLFHIYSSNWKPDGSAKEFNEEEYIRVLIFFCTYSLKTGDLRFLNTSLKVLDSKILQFSFKDELRDFIYKAIEKTY